MVLSSSVWRGISKYSFCVGLVAGGLLSAAVLLVVGSLVRIVAPVPVWLGLMAVWFVVMALRELGVVSFPMPQNARLVPESVFRHGPVLGPFEFGYEMGTGVRTYVTSSLPYLLVPMIALFSTPLTAVLAGVGFGLGRSLMTLMNLSYDSDGGWDFAWGRHQRKLQTALLLMFASSAIWIGMAALG
ncbi:hypothetical protein ACTQ49_11105 [Luteococcus sp. Sow4_B9]|uniref:hypothetical protein n=1 Tax=Luteococcus sp. Sow4_B9 TaxID=3438792 RepID=UPI003F961021